MLSTLPLFFALLVVGDGCTPRRTPGIHYEPMGPGSSAEYHPSALTKVAVAPPKDLTPASEAGVKVEDPLTGTLVRNLRAECPFEIIPGHVPGSREFMEALRVWYQKERGAEFPTETFNLLKEESPADAYLVLWLDRSSRPWMVDDSLQKVPAPRYELETTALLLSPDARVFWAVCTVDSRPFKEGELGRVVKDSVEAAVRMLLEALLTDPGTDGGRLPKSGAPESRETPDTGGHGGFEPH